jgi:hypothetical protein
MRSLLLALAVLAVIAPAASATRAPSPAEHSQLLASAKLYADLVQQATPTAKGLTGKYTAFKMSTAAPGYGFGGVTFTGPNTTLETLGLLLQHADGAFWGVVDEGCCDSYGCQSAVKPVYKDWLGIGLPSICPHARKHLDATATAAIPGVTGKLRKPATFALAKGGALVLHDLSWTGWGTPLATATGTLSTGAKGDAKVRVHVVGLTFTGGHGSYNYVEWEYAGGGGRLDGYPKPRYAMWLSRAGATLVS